MRAKSFRCHGCGGSLGYKSRPKGFIEKWMLPLLLLKPVRCGDCMRRRYRFRWVNVRDRIAPPAKPDVEHKAAA